MTPVSRSGPAAALRRARRRGPIARDRGHIGASATWHAACILLGGCLQVAPYRGDDVNQPPTILLPEGGETTVSLFASLPVVVAAVDPEGDPLVFLWSAPGYGLLDSNEREEDDVTTSTAVIPYDPALDGEAVECLVVDQSDRFNGVPVTFFVELE